MFRGFRGNQQLTVLFSASRLQRKAMATSRLQRRLRKMKLQRQQRLRLEDTRKLPPSDQMPDFIVYTPSHSEEEEEEEESSEIESSEDEKDSAAGSESGLSHDSTSSSEGDGEPRLKLSDDVDEDDIREAAQKRRRKRRRARKAWLLEEEKKAMWPDRYVQYLHEFYEQTGGEKSWKRTFGWNGNGIMDLNRWSGLKVEIEESEKAGSENDLKETTKGNAMTKSNLGDQNQSAKSSFSPMPRIVTIDLPTNNVVGAWRRPFRRMWYILNSSLRSLRLSRNRLTGNIPRCLCSIPTLETLMLDDNKLSGTIPDAIYKLKNLKVLNIRQNNLEGSVNACLFLTNLVSLELSENNFSGALVLENLCKMHKLGRLNLSYNTLAGSFFTEEVCAGLSNSIEEIRLSGNNFNGELISQLGEMTKLRSLLLDDNMFVGVLPNEICKLTNLQRLWLSKNGFVGQIPKRIGRLRQLRTLDLGHNELGPLVPDSIGKLKRLHVLRINDNSLVGFFNVSQVQKLTLLEEISFANNEYLDDLCLENIRDWAANRGISLKRRDDFKNLEIKAADAVTESSDSEDEADQHKKGENGADSASDKESLSQFSDSEAESEGESYDEDDDAERDSSASENDETSDEETSASESSSAETSTS